MKSRFVQADLTQSLNAVPVVGLLGSRQTGKTTLAKSVVPLVNRPVLYLDLELSSDFQAMANPQMFLQRHADKLVIIDEVQRMPALFPLLHALVDQERVPGRFLLLGSASPHLLRQASESLTGRIRWIELGPFQLGEVTSREWQTLWLRGGYPESFLAVNDSESLRWRLDYLASFLERDLPNLGLRLSSSQLRRLWTMLAHQQAQQGNASSLAGALGVSAPTIKHYIEVLVDTFMVRTLSPWAVNVGKRLVKSPKVLIRDAGLVHALLGISSFDQLLSHPVAGHSWEAFCLENVIGNLPFGWAWWFYRTAAGAEMDLVLEAPGGKRYGVEVKLGLDSRPGKGFYQSAKDLETVGNYVLTPGEHRIPLDAKTEILPPWTFATEVLPTLR